MKTKYWTILFVALVILAGFSQFLLHIHSFSRPGTMASVYQEGNPLRRIDLSRVEAPYTFAVTGAGDQENVILVEPGQISIQSATCRDQICVNQGPISQGIRPIVCLPHGVLIQIAPSVQDRADARTGG